MKRNIFISAGIIVLTIGIAFGILRSNETQRLLPPFSNNPPENITGISTPIDNQWNLYTNEVLGFELAYPARKFQYGQLTPRERKGSWPTFPKGINDLRSGGPFFSIYFSDGDSRGIEVTIEPSYASTIQEWLEQQFPKTYAFGKYELMRTSVSGYEAMILRDIPSNPSAIVEGDGTRELLVVIRNDILFAIDTNFLRPEEQQRIFQSFRFLP